MRIVLTIIVSLVVTLGAPTAQALDAARAVKRHGRAIVTISTDIKPKSTPAVQVPEGSKTFHLGQGSGVGFIVDSKGYAVTASTVVIGARKIKAKLADGRSLPATIVGIDTLTNLALIKIDSSSSLPRLWWGNSGTVALDASFFVLGQPPGAGLTAVRSSVAEIGVNLNFSAYDNFIRTSPVFSKGFTGGPMIDGKGQVLGIFNAVSFGQGAALGEGFIMPGNAARFVIKQLIKYGKVNRGWLGIQIQKVTEEIAENLGLDEAEGALIASVVKDSPAARAKLKTGDIILTFDGKEVRQMRQLPLIVAETPINKPVSVMVRRGMQTKELSVTIGELVDTAQLAQTPARTPPSAPLSNQIAEGSLALMEIGVSVAPLTTGFRSQYNIGAKVTGVAVTKVDENGKAAEQGIISGDVIVEVNQSSVQSPSDVVAEFGKIRAAERKSSLFLVHGQRGLRFVALRLNPDAVTKLSTFIPKSAPAEPKPSIDTAAAKPSIFVAYPKGGEELAEDSVNVVGYVTSANRTEDFAVFVNRFPLNVSSLWTGAALNTEGLRGYPVELTLPLQTGENRIELQVKDAEGFVERKTIVINRIEIDEGPQTANVINLPPRLPNMTVAGRNQSVSSDNFMAVLGDWVKDTAKSDYNKGNSMYDQGRFARAAYYYRKAVKTDPLGQAWFNLGISEKALGNMTKADKAFATACQMKVSQACDVAG